MKSKKSVDELMKEALDFLSDARFSFACFVSSFERAVKLLNEEINKNITANTQTDCKEVADDGNTD